ncbi:MAG: tetratricopeptide repeat protein [Burkholderiales bacterium]
MWDDDYLVGDNPFIKSPLLFAEAFRHYLFPDGFSAHYRPIQNISLGIDYFFWNTDAWGYHLTNVLLHVTSGLFLYFLLRKLFAGEAGSCPLKACQTCRRAAIASLCAFFVALLWTVHPVHSAAIDYISGRADSLAFLFASGAWLLFLHGRTGSRPQARLTCYLAAAVCALLALCSREIAAIWIALFLSYLCFFEVGVTRRAKLIAIGCCLLLLGTYVGLRQLPPKKPTQVAVDSQPNTAPLRATLMLRALGDYARLMVYPSTLYMERSVTDPKNYRSRDGWRGSVGVEYLSILGLVTLCALIYGATRRGRGQRLRIFGLLWFLLAYLPISNLVELNATVAEHWLYLPSVGFLIFLAGIVQDFPIRLQRIMLGVASIFVIALSARSYLRSTDWVTPKTFYQRTMAAGGSSVRVAVNLGLIYANDGEYAKAEAIFRRVLELWPDYPSARNNLADVLCREGKRAEGEAIFAASKAAAPETRKEYPRTWVAVLNLARIRHLDHDDETALAILDRARLDYPHIWEIIRFQSEILRETKGPDAALRLIAAFVEDNWWHHGANVSLGRLLWEKGDLAGALDTLRFASWLDVHEVEALNLLVGMHLQQSRLEEARLVQERAVRRQPDEPRQYLILADILQRMNRTDEANRARARFEQLQSLAHATVAKN